MRSPLFLGLLLLAAVLASLAWLELSGTAPIAAVSGPDTPAGPAATTMPGAAADARRTDAMVAAILARPLFQPSRRPPSEPAGSAAAAPALPRLTGIIVTPNGHFAIFATAEADRSLVLAEGGRVGGFLVQSIAADRVVVVGGNGRRVLQPTFDQAPARPAAAGIPARLDAFPRRSPAPPAAAPSPRSTIPGLTGRPLGLPPQPNQAASSGLPAFPSVAAPANPDAAQ
jgi:hypothetical protein